MASSSLPELQPVVTKRRWPSLTAFIFMGLFAGIAIGALAPNFAVGLEPLSQLFLRLIKMLIAPLLFATLTVGIAGSGDAKKVGRMGLKTILYFELATTVALIIGLTVANWLQPGSGLSLQLGAGASAEMAQIAQNASQVFGSAKGAVHHGFLETLVPMVPESIVDAMAKGNILQIVVFTTLFALALMASGDKGKPVLRLMESVSEVIFNLVNIVMKVAPLGVMGAMAATVGKNGLGVLLLYAKLVGSLYFALGLFVLVVLVTACSIIKVPFGKMLSAIREPFVVAFSTASSESALPKAMAIMERFGVPKYVVSFVMPTGYSFNLDGSTLYLALATLFVAQLANIHLDLGQQVMIMLTLMLTSKGVAAVPRTSLVILAGTLTAFGLPVEGVAVILGIDHVLDMGRTSVNLVGNCVATAVIARWEGVFDDEKMRQFSVNDDSGDATPVLVEAEDIAAAGSSSANASVAFSVLPSCL